jgi:hypothetical protein
MPDPVLAPEVFHLQAMASTVPFWMRQMRR